MSKGSRRKRRNPAARQGPAVEVCFDGPLQTGWGGTPLLREFCDRLSLAPRLGQLTYTWAGRAYQGADYLFAAVNALLLGCQRQCEIAALGQDPGTLVALGLPGVPSQESYSRFFADASPDLAGQVLGLSARLGRQVRAPRRFATLDLDGQIVSTRGHPEGADYGYNPKRRGAKSYFATYGFVGETREMLTAELQPGSQATVSTAQALELYRRSRAALGEGIRRLRLRADAGFARIGFLRELRRDRVTYFVCWPLRRWLRPVVENLDYHVLDAKWAWAETRIKLGQAGEQRLVVRRERLEPDEQDKRERPLLDCPRYAYHLVVTNCVGWSGLRVLRFYDHRSCLENLIKEHQEDFGGNHVLSRHLAGNRLWQALALLAYNLMNWFRERILRQRRHRHTARWIRATFLALPAKVIHSGRRWYLRLWREHPVREAWQQAWQRVQAFSP